jgi:pimeloyl-ACP methyl ester carboxylesterase
MKEHGKKNKKKRALIECIITISILLVFVLFHQIMLKVEEPLRAPLGQLVEVDGHKMSVYTEGTGDKTLVFLSGSDTPSPILDFKSLFSLLSDEYRIVVVERFGYGFSNIVDKPRDIDTVLSETRAALAAADIDGPYVLCPHSMSGLEALYWAQQYPEEVEAIVGLDMAVPDAYENFKNNVFMNAASQFNAKTGIIRLLPLLNELDCVKHGTLTEEEKKIAHALLYKNFSNRTTINELKYVSENATIVGAGEIPQVPMLLFISNDTSTTELTDAAQRYANTVENAKVIQLDCPHYVHDYEYNRISKEIKAFLQERAD